MHLNTPQQAPHHKVYRDFFFFSSSKKYYQIISQVVCMGGRGDVAQGKRGFYYPRCMVYGLYGLAYGFILYHVYGYTYG